jgi:ABC-type multidrug transport system fused ATPase/permease subunit
VCFDSMCPMIDANFPDHPDPILKIEMIMMMIAQSMMIITKMMTSEMTITITMCFIVSMTITITMCFIVSMIVIASVILMYDCDENEKKGFDHAVYACYCCADFVHCLDFTCMQMNKMIIKYMRMNSF